MSGVRWASLCCLLLTANVASAEATKPRNILEFLFGQRRAEEPRSIAPPAAITPPAAAQKAPAAQAKPKPDKRTAARKHDEKKPKASLRHGATRTAALQSIDPENAPQPAPGSYRGPFRGGGNTAYCVRTCDGFYFPINHSGAQGVDRYDTACQTSCPGAETEVYFMKRGGDIKWSSSARGEGYMRLPNALKYRKERDPACTCKNQDQNWSSILAPVETMMRHAKTDVVVTEETSNEIVRGEDPATLAKKAEQQRAEQQKAGQKQAGQKQAGQDAPALPPIAGKRAEISSDFRATHIRSSFGERIAPSNRFTRIDPETTGSLPGLPAATHPAPRDAKPAAQKLPATPEAKSSRKQEAGKARTGKSAKAQEKTRTAAGMKTDGMPKASPKAEPKTARTKPVTQVAAAPAPAPQAAPEAPQDRSSLRQTLERLFSTDKR